ncbi:MAG: hypothetical protein ABW171_07265 [Steroidobacter sp.]
MNLVARVLLLLSLLPTAGCVTRPPSIAHVHLGHALTAVHVTPNRDGYLVVAQTRAEEAHAASLRAQTSGTLDELKVNVATVVAASSSEEGFGLKQSLVLAANHVSFAATSEDASANVRQAAPVFAQDISRLVERCELVALLGKDVALSDSREEAALLAEEIDKLTLANLQGEDVDSDGKVGAAPTEYGVKQLRAEFDTMIAREDPPYRTVDQWYLFNLVRLPSGRWVFDKLNRGGNIEGYK